MDDMHPDMKALKCPDCAHFNRFNRGELDKECYDSGCCANTGFPLFKSLTANQPYKEDLNMQKVKIVSGEVIGELEAYMNLAIDNMFKEDYVLNSWDYVPELNAVVMVFEVSDEIA